MAKTLTDDDMRQMGDLVEQVTKEHNQLRADLSRAERSIVGLQASRPTPDVLADLARVTEERDAAKLECRHVWDALEEAADVLEADGRAEGERLSVGVAAVLAQRDRGAAALLGVHKVYRHRVYASVLSRTTNETIDAAVRDWVSAQGESITDYERDVVLTAAAARQDTPATAPRDTRLYCDRCDVPPGSPFRAPGDLCGDRSATMDGAACPGKVWRTKLPTGDG